MLLKEIYEGERRIRLSFHRGRWKICVVSPCGDAFVCIGLYEEMSHKALRHQGPLSGQGPRLQLAGGTR